LSGALLGDIVALLKDDSAIISYGDLAPEPISLTGLQIASRQLEVRGERFATASALIQKRIIRQLPDGQYP
jgi:hypothetical protein